MFFLLFQTIPNTRSVFFLLCSFFPFKRYQTHVLFFFFLFFFKRPCLCLPRCSWLKLSKYETSTGRAFGNSLDEHTLGGRSLFVHNLLYSTDRKLDPPPASFDPTWTGTHARLGATAGHLYDSDIVPPKLHEWVHYVTVWDQNEVNMYQNGKLVGREALYGDGNDSISTLGSQNFCIGNHEFSHKGGKFKLNGYVGLVRVWSKALSSSSVVQLHAHAKERFSN